MQGLTDVGDEVGEGVGALVGAPVGARVGEVIGLCQGFQILLEPCLIEEITLAARFLFKCVENNHTNRAASQSMNRS